MPKAAKVKTFLRHGIEITLTIGLFTVSALLSIRLFWQLAGNDKLAAWLLASVAVLFEGAKVSLWFWGVQRKAKGAIILALILVGLSLFASFASALAIMRAASETVQATTEQSSTDADYLESLDAKITDIAAKQNALPPDWVSAWNRYENALKDLRSERETTRQRLEASAASEAEDAASVATLSLFDAVGSYFTAAEASHALEELIRLVYLLIVAGMLEVVAMTMAWYEIKGVATVPALAEYKFVLDNGVTHLAAGPLTLCGRTATQVLAGPGNTRLCPNCAMKAELLRLQSK